MLQSDAYAVAARSFAERYAKHSPREESERAVADVLGLLATA